MRGSAAEHECALADQVVADRKKKKRFQPKPSPLRSTVEHSSGALLDRSIAVNGRDFDLIGSDQIDPWAVYVEPDPDWPQTLIAEHHRDLFLAVWEQQQWPRDMVRDLTKGAISLIIGNEWGIARVAVSVALESEAAFRVITCLAQHSLDPWTLPAHQVPLVIYGLLIEPLSLEQKDKIDRFLSKYGDRILERSEHEEIQAMLDEFDLLIAEEDLDVGAVFDEDDPVE